MTKLADLNARIRAHLDGQEFVPQQSAEQSLLAIVEAIQSLSRQMEQGEDHDYTSAFERLGKAVAAALETQGQALVDAIGKAAITVEAPNVTVEASPVTVNPEFEVVMPERDLIGYQVNRNEEGLIDTVFEVPVEQLSKKTPAQPVVELE